MYPLKFENLYYEKIWGGREFEKFRTNVPKGNIGESWDVSCNINSESIIKNGKYSGMNLDELIKLKGEKIIGTKISKDKFPLLIKLIDARENLSIQVHPNDEYAKQEGKIGKTEAWYILEAEKDSKIILGFKDNITEYELGKIMKKGEIEKYVNQVPVKKGQVYFVKSGLIHSIGAGVVLAEIQQNSDTTYRIYDYNRGRSLNIDKGLNTINLELKAEESKGLIAKKKGYNKIYLCLCREFALELYEVETFFREFSDKERFYCFTCVEGNGEVIYKDDNNNLKNVEIKKADSILIPAFQGEYKFCGKMKILKSYLPDLEKVKEKIFLEIQK